MLQIIDTEHILHRSDMISGRSICVRSSWGNSSGYLCRHAFSTSADQNQKPAEIRASTGQIHEKAHFFGVERYYAPHFGLSNDPNGRELYLRSKKFNKRDRVKLIRTRG